MRHARKYLSESEIETVRIMSTNATACIRAMLMRGVDENGNLAAAAEILSEIREIISHDSRVQVPCPLCGRTMSTAEEQGRIIFNCYECNRFHARLSSAESLQRFARVLHAGCNAARKAVEEGE
jgi:predicted RNA-binding Zn-ribbon protein involved in translation (DUF1610 family)